MLASWNPLHPPGEKKLREQTNASKKSEKQPVDIYGGRVRSITGDGDIQTTKAFVRQVVDRIQGVIEAKLTPIQAPSIPVLPTAYPGLNYQSSPFYSTPYPTVSPPQIGYNIVNTPQLSNIIPRNVCEIATNNTPNSARIYDEKRRCWIGNDEKHFASNCPNKVLKDNVTNSTGYDNNRPYLNNPNEPCRYWKKVGHTVKDCYRLVHKKIAEDAERLRLDSLQPPVTSARVILYTDDPKPTRDEFVYISATINGNVTRCLCDSGCDVNLLPVHFVNLENVLLRDCKLFAAGGTLIEVIGHCRVPIRLENGFIIYTEFIISPASKNPC